MNEFSGALVLYAPCGAGSGVVAVFPAAKQVSAVMILVVLRPAMSGCLFLQLSQLQVPLMT